VEILHQVLAIFLVFGLLGLCVWALRRRQGARPLLPNLLHRTPKAAGRQMQLIERLPLTPHHSLNLVRIQDRQVLVAIHPSGIAFLPDAPPSFANEFRNAVIGGVGPKPGANE
jgi:flagellar biogenesis protein FliO